jgi:hypothetical protein
MAEPAVARRAVARERRGPRPRRQFKDRRCAAAHAFHNEFSRRALIATGWRAGSRTGANVLRAAWVA